MIKFHHILFLLLFVNPVCLISQVDQNDKAFDTLYIKDLSNKLAIRVYGINKFNRFRINDNNLGKTVNYNPNSSVNLGFAVNYKWFGLGLAFNFPFLNNDDDIYGKTQRFDIQLSIFPRKFLLDFYLQNYKGFYIENPQQYYTNWAPGNAYPHRSDIYTTSLGSSFTWIFNDQKYSAKAAFIQTDIQKKSAGSFLLGGYFNLLGIGGDSTLLPGLLRSQFDPELFFNGVSVASLGIAFGYSHTFVMWKKLNFSFTLAPGIASQNYQVTYPDSEENYSGTLISGRFLARLAIVYNSQKAFGGLIVSNDSFSGNTSKTQRNSISADVGVVRFFYGRRFQFKSKK